MTSTPSSESLTASRPNVTDVMSSYWHAVVDKRAFLMSKLRFVIHCWCDVFVYTGMQSNEHDISIFTPKPEVLVTLDAKGFAHTCQNI